MRNNDSYQNDTLTLVRLRGMLGIIQSKNNLILRIYFYPCRLFSMPLISPNFDVKSIIFSQFWPGAFPQNLF